MLGYAIDAARNALQARWPIGCSRPIVIRPLRPDDGPLIGAFVRTLSPHSRTLRFHAGVRELSARALERFTHVDADREVALVATMIDAGREVGIGEARYAVVEGECGAREFAVAVADAAQGLGLGARLLRRLVRHAERAGIERLYGDVIRDNLPMLALARRLGFKPRRHPDDATLQRVEKDLSR